MTSFTHSRNCLSVFFCFVHVIDWFSDTNIKYPSFNPRRKLRPNHSTWRRFKLSDDKLLCKLFFVRHRHTWWSNTARCSASFRRMSFNSDRKAGSAVRATWSIHWSWVSMVSSWHRWSFTYSTEMFEYIFPGLRLKEVLRIIKRNDEESWIKHYDVIIKLCSNH